MAFGSTLASAQTLSEPQWRARLESRSQFVVRDAVGHAIGLAGGIVDADGVAELVSMWVTPEWRGRGVGDRLVDEVVDWACSHGFERIRLWVAAENAPAERLYARHGFQRTGGEQPIRPDAPERKEVEMARLCGVSRAEGEEAGELHPTDGQRERDQQQLDGDG